MPPPNHGANQRRVDPRSELLGLEPGSRQLWRPEELAVVFEHQMAAPVAFDLGGANPAAAQALRRLCETRALLVRSFGDLFQHRQPPLELLRLTKDFAKANRDHPEAVLPREIALALYYGSIAAALVHCGARITELSDAALRHAFDWLAHQPWVDAPMKELVVAALERVGKVDPPPPDPPPEG